MFRSGWSSLTTSSPVRALAEPVDAAQVVALGERAQLGELDPFPLRAGNLVADRGLRADRPDERP